MGEEIAQFGHGIAPLGFHAQERCHWAPWREIAGIFPNASMLA